MVRTYARIAGVVLLALAVVGFSRQEAASVRQMVGGLGVLLVVVKVITIVTPLTWGGPPKHGPIEITCLVLGITSILAARYLKDGGSA
jgi:hypothetical protein